MSILWTITKKPSSVVRYETNSTDIDLRPVASGDYVNVVGTFNAANQGSFTITNVEFYFIGATQYQAFEILNSIGVAETVTQLGQEVLFFRPEPKTIQSIAGPTAIASQAVPGTIEVVLPATAKAVTRTIGTGSYLHDNDSQNVNRIQKNGTEIVVYYDGLALPVSTKTVEVSGVEAPTSRAFISPGAPGTYPATGTNDASLVDSISVLQDNTADIGRAGLQVVGTATGAYLVGGHSKAAGVPVASTAVSRFSLVSSAAVSDATLADGAIRSTYQWLANGTTSYGAERIKTAPITAGPRAGDILFVGGAASVLSNWSAVNAVSPGNAIFAPSTPLTTMGTYVGALGHSLTPLSDGRVLAYGGDTNDAGLSALVNKLNGIGRIWNTSTVWTTSAFTGTPRANHTATLLNSGDVLIVGGQTGAKYHPTTGAFAHWKLDDSGATLTDSGLNGLDLADTGSIRVPGKIGGGRSFNSGAFPIATRAGDAPSRSALLGEWTIQWWGSGATGTYPGTMALNGVGSGTILAYTNGSESSEAENTLLEISITGGGDLKVRWQHDGSVDETNSAPITGEVQKAFNHFAIRKTLVGVGTYDLEMFVNGKLLAQFPGLTNATGGTSLNGWQLGNFGGVLNDVIVKPYSASDREILLNYFSGSGSVFSAAGNKPHRVGELTNSCETWNETTGTQQTVGSAILARASHTATKLSDGRVLLIGGLAYNPTNFVSDLRLSASDDLNGPSKSTGTTEIYNPVSKTFERGPTFNIRRHDHVALYVPLRNAIYVLGGQSTQADDTKTIEILDLNTMSVSVFAEKPTYTIESADLIGGSLILCSTNQVSGGAYIRTHQLISLENQNTNGQGLNQTHIVTELGSGFFKAQSDHQSHFSNFSLATSALSTAQRTANVTTITLSSPHQFVVGQKVFVNFYQNPAAFGSGLKTITSKSATTISYSETASDQGTTSVTGQIHQSPNTTTMASLAAGSDTIPGPYIFDYDGVAVSSVETTTTAPYNQNQRYTVLSVADSTQFPDASGWVVLSFGNSTQTDPIRYFGRSGVNGILIDSGYQFKDSHPAGTIVTLLHQREPFEPVGLVGGLYVTDSSAGMILAKKYINDIVGAGINVKFLVVYPGDRGLGGEGLGVDGTKTSDVVQIWSSDGS